MKAMILAAGEGTRLQPLTNNKPKALVSFHGIPMLEIVMRRLVKAGFDEIIINVFHLKEQIIQFVNDNKGFGATVTFSEEEQLLDTGGGIKKAAALFGSEPVLFHNVDVLTNIDFSRLYKDHLTVEGIASLVVKNRPTSRQLIFNGQGLLAGWHHPENRIRIITRNKGRGYAETAFSGIYILNPAIFSMFPEEEKFSLTPWLLELSAKNEIQGWDQEDDYWFDLGTQANLTKAEKLLAPVPEEPGSFIPV